jgi:secreted Zn-dependent insulinase-like peptidase
LPWIRAEIGNIVKMSAAAFADLKKNIIDNYKTETRDFTTDFNDFLYGQINQNGDFDYKAKIVSAIEQLSKKEFQTMLLAAVDPRTESRISVYLNAKGFAAAPFVYEATEVSSVEEIHKLLPSIGR